MIEIQKPGTGNGERDEECPLHIIMSYDVDASI
jgi:hypothetical protein